MAEKNNSQYYPQNDLQKYIIYVIDTKNKLKELVETAYTSDNYKRLLNVNIFLEYIAQNTADNPNITFEFVCAFPEIKWSFFYLSKNPNITWEHVIKSFTFPDSYSSKWVYSQLINRLGVNWNLVQKYPNLSWNYTVLSDDRFNDHWNILFDTIHQEWDFTTLSRQFCCLQSWIGIYESNNKPIPNKLTDYSHTAWKIINAYPQKKWDYKKISTINNKQINWNVVTANADQPWDYKLFSTYNNVNTDLIKLYPDDRWDYDKLSECAIITSDLLSTNVSIGNISPAHIPWNYSLLSQNTSLTWDIILNYPNKPWDYFKLLANPAMSNNLNIILEKIKHYDYAYSNYPHNSNQNVSDDWMLCNPTITMNTIRGDPDKIYRFNKLANTDNKILKYIKWEFIEENIQLNWDFNILSRKENINWDIIDRYPDKNWDYEYLSVLNLKSNKYYLSPFNWNLIDKYPHKNWDYKKLSKIYPKIDYNLIRKYPDKNWDYNYLSADDNLDWNLIIDFPDKQWNYRCLSSQPGMSKNWNIIKLLPDKNWDYHYGLSENKNFNWDLLRELPTKNWNYIVLSHHRYIDVKYILSNPNFTWDWNKISENSNITWQIVLDNPNIQWNYKTLTSNPNITWDIICANPDKNWNYDLFVKNINFNINILIEHHNKFKNIYVGEILLTFNPILYTKLTTNIIKKTYFIIQPLSDFINKYI